VVACGRCGWRWGCPPRSYRGGMVRGIFKLVQQLGPRNAPARLHRRRGRQERGWRSVLMPGPSSGALECKHRPAPGHTRAARLARTLRPHRSSAAASEFKAATGPTIRFAVRCWTGSAVVWS
jgi:hypothetical protein